MQRNHISLHLVGDYLDFLKFRSFISRNCGFLENCFSISRFSFFSLVGLFFSIKTNNSNFNSSFILTLHCSQNHLHREQDSWTTYHLFHCQCPPSHLRLSSIPQCLHSPFFNLEENPILLLELFSFFCLKSRLASLAGICGGICSLPDSRKGCISFETLESWGCSVHQHILRFFVLVWWFSFVFLL